MHTYVSDTILRAATAHTTSWFKTKNGFLWSEELALHFIESIHQNEDCSVTLVDNQILANDTTT